MEGGRGFLAGALGGLALGLLLLGVVSIAPQSITSPRTALTSSTLLTTAAQNQSGVRPAMDNSSCPPEPVWVPPCFYKTPVLNASQSSNAPAPAGAAALQTSSSSSASGASQATPASLGSLAVVPQVPRPSSTLSMLPAEGVATLVVTLAPVVIGLALAVLVYGVYARREDASS